MPPRSPTQAFDPTPALEHSSFSHFNGVHRHSPEETPHSLANGRMVHFEEQGSNSVHGRHSIATSNVPLLPPVQSASHIPKQAFRITNPTPSVDITAYFEQCRNVNEQLRSTHEQERKAWEIERTALRTRIADLEFNLNKATGGRRRLSNESSSFTARSVKTDFHVPTFSRTNGVRHHNSISHAPIEHLKQENGKPIWEPASPAPATRVFSHDDDVPPHHLPSISEDGPTDTLSKQNSHENKTIPIQEIDETLDGINVKSEGVKSSFNKVMSPIIIASPVSPQQQLVEPPRLSLDPSSLLDPLDAKLTRNAGHTPLVFDGPISSSATTDGGGATPQPEKPAAPAPTARPPLRPKEHSQSYFSTDDIHAATPPPVEEQFPETAVSDEDEDLEPHFVPEDDKPLTGPLMLDPSGKSEASHNFLDKLDDKLEEVVRKSLSSSPNHSPVRQEQHKKQENEDEGFPTLRLKKSTNFGSAFGNLKPVFSDR